jgi:CBS domain-containing protein
MFVERMLPAARSRLVIIREDAPLIDAATLLRDLDSDLVVVCNSGELLVGVITKTDVARQISHCGGAGCVTAASTVMTRTVILCRPGDRLHEVWSVMKERRLQNVPIATRTFGRCALLDAFMAAWVARLPRERRRAIGDLERPNDAVWYLCSQPSATLSNRGTARPLSSPWSEVRRSAIIRPLTPACAGSSGAAMFSASSYFCATRRGMWG